MEKIDPQIS